MPVTIGASNEDVADAGLRKADGSPVGPRFTGSSGSTASKVSASAAGTDSSGSAEGDGGELGGLAGRGEEPPQVRLWPAYTAMFLDMLTLSITIPYLSVVAAKSPYAQRAVLPGSSGHVAAAAAMVRGQDLLSACAAAEALAHLCTAGLLGTLCDRVGARPVGALAAAGVLTKVVMLFLCAPSDGTIPFAVERVFPALVAAFTLSGVFGNVKLAATALVAKGSRVAARSQNFGRLAGISFVGFLTGQLFNIVIAECYGREALRFPLAVACTSEFLALCCILGTFPKHFRESTSTPWSNSFLWVLVRRTLGSSRTLAALGLMLLADNIGVDMYRAVAIVFCRARFEFDTFRVSLYLLSVGILTPVVLNVLYPRMLQKAGERWTLRFGSVMLLLACLLLFFLGLTRSGWAIFLVVPVTSLSRVAEPVLTSFASRELPPEEQGSLLGAFSAIVIVAQLVSPLVATYTLHRTIDTALPSATFLIAAAITAPAVAMAWCIKPKAVTPAPPAKELELSAV